MWIVSERPFMLFATSSLLLIFHAARKSQQVTIGYVFAIINAGAAKRFDSSYAPYSMIKTKNNIILNGDVCSHVFLRALVQA